MSGWSAIFALLFCALELSTALNQHSGHGWRLDSKVKISDDVISMASSLIHGDSVYTLTRSNPQSISEVNSQNGDVIRTIPVTDSANITWSDIHTSGCVRHAPNTTCLYLVSSSSPGRWILQQRKEIIMQAREQDTFSLNRKPDERNIVEIYVASDRTYALIRRFDGSLLQVDIQQRVEDMPIKSRFDFQVAAIGEHGLIMANLNELWTSGKESMWEQLPTLIFRREAYGQVFLGVDWALSDGFYVLQKGKHIHVLHYTHDKTSDRMMMDSPSTTQTRFASTCVDYSGSSCPAWKTAGLCISNQNVKNVYCQLTCAACSNNTAVIDAKRIVNQPSRSTSSCVDKNSNCGSWAEGGMCEKRPDYMSTNCQKSCQTCGNARTSQCFDRNSFCSYWAAAGQCDSELSRDFMNQSCKKSCEICTESEQLATEVCVDKIQSGYCKTWHEQGRCQQNKKYMELNCAATCLLCPSTSANQKSVLKVCKDLNNHCERWAAKDKCATRKDFMYSTCPASCKLCADSSLMYEGTRQEDLQCQDSSQYCAVWMAHNMCELKSKYMREKCGESCGYCTKKSYSNDRASTHHQNSCEDKGEFCQTWKDYGLCEKKRDFMIENCPNTCGTCTTSINNQRDEPVHDEPICENTKPFCDVWAQGGYCTKHADYMTTYCPAACATCVSSQGGALTCDDKHKMCPQWADEGRCRNRPDFMLVNCRLSCLDECKPTDKDESRAESAGRSITTSGQETECRDLNQFCRLWKAAGKCSTRPDHMAYYCRKSCDLCSSSSSQTNTMQKITDKSTTPKPTTTQAPTTTAAQDECKDNLYSCVRWEISGYCKSQSNYMKMHCRKTCRFCESDRATVTDTAAVIESGTSPRTKSAPATKKQPTDKCEDAHSFCVSWALQGRCTVRADFMLRVCKKSCNAC